MRVEGAPRPPTPCTAPALHAHERGWHMCCALISHALALRAPPSWLSVTGMRLVACPQHACRRAITHRALSLSHTCAPAHQADGASAHHHNYMYRCALECSSSPWSVWTQNPADGMLAGGREVRERSNHRTLDFRVVVSGCGWR